jgi:hypothetical protein
MVGPKKQDFLAKNMPKINILKGNHCILKIHCAPIRQKLGMILENKVVQKLKLEKNVFLQKMVSLIDILQWIFFFEKILSIFDIENWLWEDNFCTFWQTIIHSRIVLKHYKLKPSFSIIKDEKAKDKVGVWGTSPHPQVSKIWSSLIQFDQV